MTENSYPWAGSILGDHGAYTADQWAEVWQYLFSQDRTTQGVVAGLLNSLAVSNPAGNTIRVATGAALVDGVFYKNTADVDNTIATPAAGNNRYDRIVLRKSWADQTVRVTVITGTPGAAPSVPAVTQTDETTWDLYLAKVYITDGAVITVTDEREFAAFSGSKMPKRQGGHASNWNTVGTTTYLPTLMKMQCGAALVEFTNDVYIAVTVTFPVAFSGVPLVFVTVADPTTIAEDIYYHVKTVAASNFVFKIEQIGGTAITGNYTIHWLAIGI